MCYTLTKCGVWAVLATLLWTAQPVPGQTIAATSLVLNLLRNYGWEPPDSPQVERPSIVVDRERRVLVGFTVRERKGLVTRTQPSLSFRIVRFSASGEEDMSLSLPTNAAGRTAIYLSDTDQIIARANDSLQFLQSGERKVQESVWKSIARCTLQSHIEQSISRHTLFLYSEDADPPLTIIRLSPQPGLQRCGKAPQLIKSTEDKIQNYPQFITDDFAYFAGMTGLEPFTYRWPLCDYEHREEMSLRARGRWIALNDKLFVLNAYSGRKGDTNEGLEVISSDGQVKFRAAMAKHESAGSLWAPIRSSERGDRIAVDMFTIRGGNQMLDISGHVTARRVAVYDIEAGKEVASTPVNRKHDSGYEFDLSPDGRRLAILEDDIVKVIDLEEAAKPTEHTKAADF